MKVINLTRHDVNICDYDGNVIKTYKPSGMVARISHDDEYVGRIDDVPVVNRINEHIVDLPNPQQDTIFIVSNIVLNYCTDRLDLYAPVNQVKRQGRVIGCKALIGNR